MTVIATNAYSGPFTPNGATVAFPFTFEAASVDEVAVFRRLDGVVTEIVTGFSISLSGTAPSPGTVTFATAPVVDSGEIFIFSQPAFDQDIAFTNNGAFLPEQHDQANDLAAVRDIYLRGLISRALLLPPGTTAPELPPMEGSSVLITNPEGTAVQWADEDDFRGPTGAAGGNVQAIGLKTLASGISISAGTERVCTSGYDTIGIGAAWYHYDASFDVATYPRAGFTAADGRKFVLDRFNQPVSPFMFGVAGTVVNDDDALQAFFDFCETHIVYIPWLSGSCQVEDTITYGLNQDPVTTVFYGNHFQLAPASGVTWIDKLLHWKCKNSHVYSKLSLRGSSAGEEYSDRQTAGVGLWLDDCRGSVFHYINCQRFLYAGVDVNREPNASINNNSFITIGTFVCDGVGSGDSEDDEQSLFGTWTTPNNTGSGSDYGQRTSIVIPLAECPPEDIASAYGASISTLPLLVRLRGPGDTGGSRGRLHQVTSITRGATTATVNIFPWMDPAIGASGDLTWIWGGGIRIWGADANAWRIGSMECQRVGVALGIHCGQGPVVNRLSVQNQSGVGILVGSTAISADSNTGNGTHITGAYWEDTYDQFINMARFDDLRNSGSVAAEFTADMSLFHATQSPRAGTTGAVGAIDDEGLYNWEIRNNQVRLKFRVHPSVSPTTQGLDEYDVITYTGNTVTIRLDNVTDVQRLFGRDRALFVVKGTTAAANYAPTTVTFEVPSGDTLNGVVDGTYSLSGFTGPAIYQVDTTSTDVWRVAISSGKCGVFGSTTWNPGNLVAGANENKAVTVTGAVFGDGVVVSFDKDLQGMRLTGYVSAADTVTAALTNITGGAIDLASGTLTARIIR